MGETIVNVNGIELCAEVRGPEAGEPLLLVMGLGAQKASWDIGFVESLIDRGYRVVWFDNRDVGLSTKFDDQPVDIGELMTAVLSGETPDVPYLLADMAADAAGLLDALDIDAAHIVGVSMGGMIVQQMAIDHPHKIRSVTSIMSTTGDSDVGQPSSEASAALLRPPATTVDEAVQAALEAEQIWGSPAYLDPEAAETRARREWDRMQYPAGVARQIAAIFSSPSRTAALGEVTMPFGVIHGLADTLVTPSGGARTAEAVPHATHLEIEGMGHNLPKALWPTIIDAISATAAAATA
ncbi:alpha/beta fold hydrolase [Actinospongicola halichondriae]|uniref:alpha/beta fold hydrolase n=1 Tax=Actinospongicola halichondriae TaxID=3236844 RepID=UPI003D4F36B0